MSEYEAIVSCDLCRSTSIRVEDPQNNINKCLNCGHVYDNPRPTFEFIKQYYSHTDNYDGWLSIEDNFAFIHKRRLQIVRRYVKTGRLLDIGSGTGQFLHLAKKFYSISGTEISTKAIGIAQSKYGIQLREGQFESIDLGNEKADAITIFHVLEHVPSPSKLIEKCHNILSERGYLFIAVPNDFNLKYPLKVLLGRSGIKPFSKLGRYGLPKIEFNESTGEIHLSHFKPKVLINFLNRSGFRIVYSGLDPYIGSEQKLNRFLFHVFGLVYRLIRVNLFGATFVIAQKKMKS